MNSIKYNPKSIFEKFVCTQQSPKNNEVIPLSVAKRVPMNVDWMKVVMGLNEGKWPGSLDLGGMFELLSMVNHADEPNCVVADCYGDYWISLKTLKPVKHGEEFSYDYLLGLDNKHERKSRKEEYLIC
eukprot:TRINITY_DN200_c1_g1_i1.p1 TRINITY_DN200_c1_g1~~TRINITY_DN200_c1_g1_i1.p1  ORF type:complete len:138 (-),score=20.62 TRINITY_DN200_c1_g1_i1:25-408(-)